MTTLFKTLFLNLCIYSLRTLYGLFLCTAIISGLASLFPDDPEQSVWGGLMIALFIYVLGHYLFLKPSRSLIKIRDGNNNEKYILPNSGEISSQTYRSSNSHYDTVLHKERLMLEAESKRSHFSAGNSRKSKNQSKGQWISPNEEITIGKKTITKGLFYFGGVLKGENYGETESSLVDDSLSIKDAPYTFTDNSLGYWPSFQGLSPMCRGAYIDWLASDRDMPDVPIGYLFIYFYGLERRLIKDYKEGLVKGEECTEICKEILRLKSIFKDNYSFNGYSSRLLDYVSITHPSIFCLPDDEIEDSIYSDIFKVKLAYVAQNGEPLSPELAYSRRSSLQIAL